MEQALLCPWPLPGVGLELGAGECPSLGGDLGQQRQLPNLPHLVDFWGSQHLCLSAQTDPYRETLELVCVYTPVLGSLPVTEMTAQGSGGGGDIKTYFRDRRALARVSGTLFLLSPGASHTSPVHTGSPSSVAPGEGLLKAAA